MANEKKKPSYSILNNLRFVLGNMWRSKKGATLLAFLRSPVKVAAPFLGIYLSKSVVGAVTEQQSVTQVLWTVVIAGLALLACKIAESCLNSLMFNYCMVQDMQYQMAVLSKCFTCDYEPMESADGLTRISKASEHIGSDSGSSRKVAEVLTSLTANIIGIVFYAVMLFALSPWILLAVTVTTLSGFFAIKISASWNYRHKDDWKVYDRRMEYLRKHSGDFTHAKDMRLYSMTDWFRDVFAGTLNGRMGWHKKEQWVNFGTDGLKTFLSLLREMVAYGFLVYLIYTQDMRVADFVLYFGVIGGFTGWLNDIVDNLNQAYRIHLNFCELREYLDYPDVNNHGAGVPLPKETFSIEFKNVRYRYPGNDTDTIKDLSFIIGKGEKLAIVGLNGAGKTTLVKLICGLYNPTEGEVLVNGQPVNAYNRDEYYSLFAAVFQDIFITPVSVARNVSAATDEHTDTAKVEAALALAGLSDKVNKLPHGKETLLLKSVYDDAVDLSGGELQKLALARALYKDGKALMLDEPTAALDPIAESRIYEEYNRMTAGRTSVFISHRLASTRFCDRILYLENGIVAECGSHDELMAQKGKYYEMFEIQSQYYKEGAQNHDNA